MGLIVGFHCQLVASTRRRNPTDWAANPFFFIIQPNLHVSLNLGFRLFTASGNQDLMAEAASSKAANISGVKVMSNTSAMIWLQPCKK